MGQSFVDQMSEHVDSVQKVINTIIEFCVNYSFEVVGAIIILVLGVVVGKWMAGFVAKIC